jgi:hypothetical protein
MPGTLADWVYVVAMGGLFWAAAFALAVLFIADPKGPRDG